MLIESLKASRPSLSTGAIGLGVGTIAAYGRAGDAMTFYELDPAVQTVAETYFTYLKDSPANIRVVLGDARLSLERSAPQGFDLLVVDAFTGGNVPVHLMTREAVELYLRHVKPDGAIAFHISNRHLDLKPILWKLADELRLETVVIESQGNRETDTYLSEWMLAAKTKVVLDDERIKQAATSTAKHFGGEHLWTDTYSNLLTIIRW